MIVKRLKAPPAPEPPATFSIEGLSQEEASVLCSILGKITWTSERNGHAGAIAEGLWAKLMRAGAGYGDDIDVGNPQLSPGGLIKFPRSLANFNAAFASKNNERTSSIKGETE